MDGKTQTEMISITKQDSRTSYMHHLTPRPPVDIEFLDLSYTVPQGKGSKLILRNVSGLFRSGQLTAILGPSGAGKSTLLNALAGYKCLDVQGSILVNNKPRDIRLFQKMSRYIMQQDLLQPKLTVEECMKISAELKIGNCLSRREKQKAIDEILDMLRLVKCKNTFTTSLSGGEKKRLSIALELVNNPPVMFLDEPTTGLDDLSSSQCIALLQMLAHGGRTIICSIHTPSASLFSRFDHVYIVAQGQCVFQGQGQDIVPFLNTIGLTCPTHYNPADFVIEVSAGEYGNYIDKMSSAVDNGRCFVWSKLENNQQPCSRTTPVQTSKNEYNFTCSGWSQFIILLTRMLVQIRRDSFYLSIKFILHIFVGLVVGGMFYDMGNDGSKSLFNVGFCYVCLIVLMFVPMLPVLLAFPSEVKLLKREYFNRWYGLTSYFCAMSLAHIPVQLVLSLVFISISYILTGQPMEADRFLLFAVVLLLVAFVSESLGLALSSFLNVVNGIFMGPALSVPLMLLAVYGLGTGSNGIPTYMKLFMYLSYLRYGLEGLVQSMYGGERGDMICPEEEVYCPYKSPKALLQVFGMEHANIWIDLVALTIMYFILRGFSFLLLRSRLSTNKKIAALNSISRFIKTKFNYMQAI